MGDETKWFYWIAFLIDYPDTQLLRASAHRLYQPIDTVEGIENAQAHIEISEGHPEGSVTIWTWKAIQ